MGTGVVCTVTSEVCPVGGGCSDEGKGGPGGEDEADIKFGWCAPAGGS